MKTYKSFQKTLTMPSSPVSSSVTPPNKIPVFLAGHAVIVHPDRRDGA